MFQVILLNNKSILTLYDRLFQILKIVDNNKQKPNKQKVYIKTNLLVKKRTIKLINKQKNLNLFYGKALMQYKEKNTAYHR